MPQPTTTGHAWAVTHQEEEPTIDDNGQPTSLHHVTFKTNTGHESTVTIPDTAFNAHTVAQAITAKASEINRVHGLTSTNAPTEPE
jgi:hypothetical protein